MKWNATVYDRSFDFVTKYGEGILSYLHPKPSELILDLGCGTGDLTNQISISGAQVIGVDSSAEMIAKAKAKFPALEFYQMDARALEFDFPFDGIFSNAVLHWIPEKETVINKMYSLLKDNGRIVLEFGGKGNNQQMLEALRAVLIKRGFAQKAKLMPWYFPSIGEYATALEEQHFRVIHAEHFDRLTPLQGTIKDWFLMFGDYLFDGIPDSEKDQILEEVQGKLEKTHFINNIWNADYKRIRIVAIKMNDEFHT